MRKQIFKGGGEAAIKTPDRPRQNAGIPAKKAIEEDSIVAAVAVSTDAEAIGTPFPQMRVMNIPRIQMFVRNVSRGVCA